VKANLAIVPALCVAALATLAIVTAGAEPAVITGSPLALRAALDRSATRLPAAYARAASSREDWLAQRVVTREWGASEDTNYVEVEVPGYRSEGGAMLLSAALPGAGELYLGEGSGFAFALVEVAAWTSRILLDRRADRRHDAPQNFAGSPYDGASAWSFSRYAQATHGDTLTLQQLYAGDKDSFYHRIGFDNQFQLGWTSIGTRDGYRTLETQYQDARRRVRFATGAIILVHVASALDALHAAREHNLPLQRNLRFKVGGLLESGGETMAVALEKRF
jgi:hypothetical protein